MLGEGTRAGKLGTSVGRLRLRPDQLRSRLVELGLRRPSIDGEEELATADILAVAKVRADQIARDPRLHVDVLGSLEPAHEIVPVDHFSG